MLRDTIVLTRILRGDRVILLLDGCGRIDTKTRRAAQAVISNGVFVLEKSQEHRVQVKKQIPVLDVIKIMTDSLH
jgi:hypothetical protein